MNTSILLKGVAVGLIVALPVGPVAVVCLQRTSNQGRTQGIISGLGAATADTLFAFIAAFGLAFVSSFLVPGIKPHRVTYMSSHLDIPATLLSLMGGTNPSQDYSFGFDLLG